MLLSPNTLLSDNTLLGEGSGTVVPFDSPDLFGPLVGNPNVEDAVIGTLKTWLPYCLWEVERRNSLRHGSIPQPPTDHSYTPALDLSLEEWQQDELPAILVIVNPTGETERNASGYGSWFEIEISAVIIGDPRPVIRLAGWYGLAVSMAISQNGSLGGLADVTELLNAAVTEYPNPENRRIVRSRTVFQSHISGIVDPRSGPKSPTPPDSPQYPGSPDQPWNDLPVVTTTPLTLVAQQPE